MSPAQDRVARGGSLLDARRPGWDRLINPSTLNIARGQDCACGQLEGGYDAGLKALGLSHSDAAHYGFNGSAHEYDDLTAAWRAEIERRRLEEIAQPARERELVAV